MTATNINATTIGRSAGTTLPTATAADVANGNSTANDGNLFLIVSNTDTVPHNFTVNTQVTTDGIAAPTRQLAIAGSATQYFGPYPVAVYGQTLAYSGDNALLKFNPVSLPRN